MFCLGSSGRAYHTISPVHLPVVAAAREASSDAGPSEGCGAGIVTHVIPLGGTYAAALHVASAHTEAQARQTTNTRTIAEAGVVEASLRY